MIVLFCLVLSRIRLLLWMVDSVLCVLISIGRFRLWVRMVLCE